MTAPQVWAHAAGMNALEIFFRQQCPAPQVAKTQSHNTLPLRGTLTHIDGYPRKLVLYQMEASPYWQVRYFEDGRIVRRSTRTTDRQDAIKRAKEIFADIVINRVNGRVVTRLRGRFDTVAQELMEQQKIRVLRGEVTAATQENDHNRLRRDILPYFGSLDIKSVDYNVIDAYLNQLSQQTGRGRRGVLANASLQLHLTQIGKILRFAHRRGLIDAVPALPTLRKQDRSRDYFTPDEVSRLLATARTMQGDTDVICIQRTGQFSRNVEISEDIGDLIEFMLHTFVRPTDLRVLQHQHVAVVRREQTYLRLTQPETKRHSLPMVSMPQAVAVYERLLARRQAIGPIQPSDYVFFPIWPDRQYAITQMRRQFDLVLKRASLKTSARGESRTMYCLRHTAIMERLLNGDKIDVLSLARNARTSVEMIERFYARHLHGEMVVDKLQSGSV
jgi:integrase